MTGGRLSGDQGCERSSPWRFGAVPSVDPGVLHRVGGGTSTNGGFLLNMQNAKFETEDLDTAHT
jgi:hypothetical protein